MKKFLFIIILISSVIIINNLVRSIYGLWNKQEILVKAQKELEAKKKENAELKSQLGYVQNQDFIEKEARNKLFMVKEGESSVVIDQKLIQNGGINDISKQEENKTNPQKWWGLFFD